MCGCSAVHPGADTGFWKRGEVLKSGTFIYTCTQRYSIAYIPLQRNTPGVGGSRGVIPST